MPNNEYCQTHPDVRILMQRQSLRKGLVLARTKTTRVFSVSQNEVDPVDENDSDDRHGPPAGPTQVPDGSRSSQERPHKRQSTAEDESNTSNRREWIEGQCRTEIEVEEGTSGSCGAAGRARDSGQIAEGTRPEVRCDGDPDRSEKDGRDRRGRPEHRQLPLLAGGGPKSESSHPALTSGERSPPNAIMLTGSRQ